MLDIMPLDQNSDEWLRARAGIPTASSFHKVLAKGAGKTRLDYMRRLAGEIITGEPMENITTAAMERGHVMEDEARALYEFDSGSDVEQVGFIRNGRKGCSPDGLIGVNGGLEIKSKAPHILIETIQRGTLPPEHRAQVQGSMWVAEREWWDFVAYWPKMPPFQIRAYRDEEYIAELSDAVDRFNEALDEMVGQIVAYGAA